MRENEGKLIESTLSFWQSRTDSELTREDARQIVSNISGFFKILSEWDATSQTQSQVPQLVFEHQQEDKD